ncbi:NPCBM/NEW2 domain-containing protein [Terrisporobacter hibernicus]|uniref:NPCBM/NEW2 domain-containing protein n=1 Tax=Terrisporobacter hibernicus TaxID=2813371 RepID=A0AAX2ZDG3_9FIRM|nr:NPCBM/NEW2 domain-containing protein [Terrisporobacter hibernicus]UEL47268.1 NPCBM/NEW2 domain-containing protein [Terrisporobacter hibernicus]
MRKKVSTLVLASILSANIAPTINVFADEVLKEEAKIIEENVLSTAKVSDFNLENYSNFQEYNSKYRLKRDEIKSISNNGKQYASSSLDKAIDGNLSTHWETGIENSSTFKNEVVVEFNNVESIDRIGYATRQDGAKGKGYPNKFEIYASVSGDNEDFKLVSTGSSSTSRDMMELKFDKITAKKIKFVFKEANQNWASASEFWFYREDKLLNKLNNLFTDDNKNTLNSEFNTLDKLEALENESKLHPFYDDFKEDLSDAKIILESGEFDYSDSKVSKFLSSEDERLSSYDNSYKIKQSEVKSISANGGQYSDMSISKAMDGDFQTRWHSGKQNTDDFTNQVVIELNEITTLNRLVYTLGVSRGFAQEFDIYVSKTSKGDTFHKISSGTSKVTKDSVEIRFNPVDARRIKFVYKNGYENWACATEFGLYKQDKTKEKVERLFTDSTMNTLSEEFNTLEKIVALENQCKEHILYDDFKEDIENAKALLEDGNIEATKAQVSKFDVFYTDYKEAYDNTFKMDNSNISSISTNGGNYGSYVKDRMIDGDLKTFWETGKQNSDSFDNEIVFTLKEAKVLDRMSYRSAENTIGFADEFEIYASQTTKGDTFKLVSNGTARRTSDMLEFKFEPTKFKRIKFVYKKCNANKASASEIMFYSEDQLKDKIKNVFTNRLMNELSQEYNTLKKIEELEEGAKVHPLKEQYQEIIDLAKSLLNDQDSANTSRIVTGVQRGHYTTESGKRMVNGAAYISMESFGKYVTPGEEIVVYLDADPDGKLPELWFGQVGKVIDGWTRRIKLQPGKNTIKAPTNMNCAAVYLSNQATTKEQAYAPRARMVGGTSFPTYFHGETDPQEYRKELEEYAKKVELSDSSFTNGNPEGKVFNIAEFVSDNVVITTSALGALEGLKLAEEQDLDISDTMTQWEKMYELFQTFMGLEKDADEEKDSFFPNKFVARVFQNVPFGFAAHGYTGYLGSDNAQRDGGFFKMIAAPPNMKGNDNWCYTHEFGHILNTKYIVDGEVTNNLYAQEYRRINADKGINEDRGSWDEIFKRFNGANEEYAMHYFERLAVLSQLNIAYGYDAYAKASKAVRDNTDLIKSINGYDVQRLSVAYSLGLGVNLLDFFEGWNYSDIEITDQMRDAVKDLPKPNKKIEYLHGGAYDYEGDGFTKDIDVNVKSTLGEEENTLSLKLSVDKNNQDDVLGYEILKDGKVVGFTKTNLFTIREYDETADYTIVAYAKDLSTAQAINSKSQKPTLSIEENITLSIGDKFDAKKYVTALDYQGNVIEDIKVDSNVDTSKKGNYEVKYTVTHSDLTVEKTMKVSVVSKITYASDVQETSYKVGWGQLGKDKAPNNTAIELDRQGIVTTYTKGLGAHANSEVVYDVENYDKFESYIGIDQSMRDNPNSCAKFIIYADGEKVYESKKFTSNRDHDFVSIDLEGVKELKLVTDGLGSNGADQTVWADAKFINNNTKPIINAQDVTTVKLNSKFDIRNGVTAKDIEDGDLTESIVVEEGNLTTSKTGKYKVKYIVTDSNNNTTTKTREILVYSGQDYASDTKYTIQKSDWGGIKNDKAPAGSAISVLVDDEETTFGKGIGAHANSEITFDLSDKNYEFFTSRIGLDGKERGNTNASAKFKVLVDGKEVFESKTFKTNDDSQVINIPVNGASEIKLITDQANNNNASDHTVWADAKFLVTNSKPEITTEDVQIEVGQVIDINKNVTAKDAEDGDLTSSVEVISNNFEKNKIGRFEVVYRVTNSDKNTTEKTRYITAYEVFDVKKSKYLGFDNLEQYNEQFKIPVSSISNNAGNYGSDVITKAIDNNIDTHWETNKPNSNTFKNEVTFDLGEMQEISKMSYAARRAGKGFATSFSIYVSTKAEGNDFILAGKGNYNGNASDVVEFDINDTTARRVKFVFDSAIENWASMGEMSFYKKDELADKVASMFTNSNKEEVTEGYDTLDEINALKEEVASHPANELFQADFDKAEELVRATFPTLNIPKSQSVKVGETLESLIGKISATDTKDGNITSKIKVTGTDKVNFNKVGEYEITYSVTDSDNNTVSKVRKINVVDMKDFKYLSDYDWKSANSGWGTVNKDNSVSSNVLRLTDEKGQTVNFEKGIGTHSTSTIVYDLSDKNSVRFTSYVGVDRQMYNSPGSIQFEVYVDGEKTFDSGVMNSTTPMKFVDVDITEAKELKLIVKDGGNGNGSDHATWGDAKLHYVNENSVDKTSL